MIMNTDVMEQIIRQPEGKQLEFKRDLSSPQSQLKAIINALVHSDYSQRGSPIRIAFFDGRIETESPGMLMPGMTVEDMKRGVSMIRNPVIARVFKVLKLIEQWGSGVKRIFAEAAAQELPEPRIEEIANRLRFIVPLRQQHNSRHESVTRSVTQSDSLPDNLLPLLAALQPAALSSSELMTKLGLKHRSNFRNHYLVPALAAGLIAQTLPDTPNSRLQKYRLTPAGQQLIKELG